MFGCIGRDTAYSVIGAAAKGLKTHLVGIDPKGDDPGKERRVMRWQKRAFTLIELLVVIAIIALLMSILMPALQRVRKQAKNVMCQSELKQWGTIWAMYTDDNNGRFNTRYGAGGRWMETLADYYISNEKIRLCPLVTKIANPEMASGVDWWGATYLAWGRVPSWDAGGGRTIGFYGSYGVNGYIYVPYTGGTDKRGNLTYQPAEWFWRTPNVQGSYEIPMFLDCYFWCGWPATNNTPPQYMDWKDKSDANAMNRYCLDRHQERINGAFLDYSVRYIGLKELWTLRWHRQFDRQGPWTSAGGVQPTDWPDWMRKMKDY
jgi:prepilin-type N-terminal cleavage/methylation domain-containing protein